MPTLRGRETGSADGSPTVTDVRVSDGGGRSLRLISVDGAGGHHAMLLVSGKAYSGQGWGLSGGKLVIVSIY